MLPLLWGAAHCPHPHLAALSWLVLSPGVGCRFSGCPHSPPYFLHPFLLLELLVLNPDSCISLYFCPNCLHPFTFLSPFLIRITAPQLLMEGTHPGSFSSCAGSCLTPTFLQCPWNKASYSSDCSVSCGTSPEIGERGSKNPANSFPPRYWAGHCFGVPSLLPPGTL